MAHLTAVNSLSLFHMVRLQHTAGFGPSYCNIGGVTEF